MVSRISPYRLIALPGVIVLAWLLVIVDVLPADVAASVSLIAILCALAPISGWLGRNRDRCD